MKLPPFNPAADRTAAPRQLVVTLFRVAGRVCLLGLMLAGATQVQAQASTQVTANTRATGTSGDDSDVPPTQLSLAGDPVVLSSSSDVARYVVSGPTVLGRNEASSSVWGRAEIGHLQFSARAAGSAESWCCNANINSRANGHVQAYWNDTFTIEADPALFGQLGEMTVTLMVDGTYDLPSEVIGSIANFRISLTIQDSYGSFTQLVQGTQLRRTIEGSLVTEPPPSGTLRGPGLWQLTVPFHFGRNIGLTLWGESDVVAGASHPAPTVAGNRHGEAVSDFGHSLYWRGIGNVRLAGGNEVGTVRLKSATGYDYLRGTDPASPPANDRFENRIVLEGTTVNFRGTNIASTVEPDEPARDGTVPARSVWWEWTAPASGDTVVRISDSDFDSMVSVYTNSLPEVPPTVTQLRPVADRWCGGRAGEIYFAATAGTSYQIAVDGRSGSRGHYDAQVVMPARPINDDFANRIVLPGRSTMDQAYTHNATRETGEPNPAGVTRGRSLWWSWTTSEPALERPVTVHTAGSDFDTVLAVYTGNELSTLHLVAANDDAPSGGKTSSVTWIPQRGVTYHIAVDGGGTHQASCLFGSSGYVQVTVEYPVLRLSVQALTASTNADLSVRFSGQLMVQHYGTAPTRPLRIRLVSMTAPNVEGLHRNTLEFADELSVLPLPALSPGGSAMVNIAGAFGPGCYQASGLFGILEETFGSDWLVLDRQFLLSGATRQQNCAAVSRGPLNTGFLRPAEPLPIPGQPQLFRLLAQVSPSLPAPSQTDFPVLGLFDDGSDRTVQPDAIVWDAVSAVHTIIPSPDQTNTTLLSGLVAQPTLLALSGHFDWGGLSFPIRTNLTFYPRARLTIARAPGGQALLQLSGDPNRTYALERIQDLATGHWTTLPGTKTFTGAPLIWTDLPPDRLKPAFYRARETGP